MSTHGKDHKSCQLEIQKIIFTINHYCCRYLVKDTGSTNPEPFRPIHIAGALICLSVGISVGMAAFAWEMQAGIKSEPNKAEKLFYNS